MRDTVRFERGFTSRSNKAAATTTTAAPNTYHRLSPNAEDNEDAARSQVGNAGYRHVASVDPHLDGYITDYNSNCGADERTRRRDKDHSIESCEMCDAEPKAKDEVEARFGSTLPMLSHPMWNQYTDSNLMTPSPIGLLEYFATYSTEMLEYDFIQQITTFVAATCTWFLTREAAQWLISRTIVALLRASQRHKNAALILIAFVYHLFGYSNVMRYTNTKTRILHVLYSVRDEFIQKGNMTYETLLNIFSFQSREQLLTHLQNLYSMTNTSDQLPSVADDVPLTESRNLEQLPSVADDVRLTDARNLEQLPSVADDVALTDARNSEREISSKDVNFFQQPLSWLPGLPTFDGFSTLPLTRPWAHQQSHTYNTLRDPSWRTSQFEFPLPSSLPPLPPLPRPLERSPPPPIEDSRHMVHRHPPLNASNVPVPSGVSRDVQGVHDEQVHATPHTVPAKRDATKTQQQRPAERNTTKTQERPAAGQPTDPAQHNAAHEGGTPQQDAATPTDAQQPPQNSTWWDRDWMHDNVLKPVRNSVLSAAAGAVASHVLGRFFNKWKNNCNCSCNHTHYHNDKHTHHHTHTHTHTHNSTPTSAHNGNAKSAQEQASTQHQEQHVQPPLRRRNRPHHFPGETSYGRSKRSVVELSLLHHIPHT